MPKTNRTREQRAEGRRAADRSREPDGRPIGIVTRQAINMRLPFELLDRMDAIKKRQPKLTRTDIVVGALMRFLPAFEPRSGR